MTVEEWLNNNELSINIFNKKYRYNNESFEEFLDRVSGGNSRIKDLIKNKKFLFGGRILSGRGNLTNKQTLSNCYVLPMPEDNLESIFDVAKMAARTYSAGGGCGINVSKLRPKDAIVHNAAKTTTGPTSFMELYSFVTGLIGQNNRRGALILSLDCFHPDIEEFINLKTKEGVCEKANISVMVTDDFMTAALEDKEWETIYDSKETGVIKRTFKAKDLLYLLAKRNWEWAEPGILYWDRIINYNLNSNNPDYRLVGTNPCGEIPLQSGGACLLGSINLSEFVIDPFTKQARINWEDLEYTVVQAVVGLNQALDENINTHPLKIQRETAYDWRAIGLGTMGMADMLIKLGLTYGSEEALNIVSKVYKNMAVTAIESSLELAKDFGCYPKCNKEILVESPFIKALDLPENIINDIRTYGLYNSQLLTCAPTGSIGTMLEVSTGVEPNFALHYTRRTQSLDGKDSYYEVNARILADYLTLFDTTEVPDYFITAAQINPIDRIKMQGTIQKYIDNSISSTINLPKEATIEDVYKIYINAWKYGLKGVTVYRSGCKREGILTVDKPTDIQNTVAPKRPKELEADFYLVKSKGQQFIVLVGLLNNKPYEIFAFRPNMSISVDNHKGTIIKKSKMHYSFKSQFVEIGDLQLRNEDTEEKAATLYASMLLRHGIDIKYIIKTAKKVNDNITSFSSAMCRVLSKYIPKETLKDKCPDCGGELIREGGCIHCKNCGYSKCE